MHLTSVEHGAMGSYAIVGAHLPIAAGAAWSAQYRGSGQVAVCFFGDGTTNIGAFHEALNLAAVWQAAGRLRLREQPVHGVHADRRGDRGGPAGRRPGRRPTASSRSSSTATTSTRSTTVARTGDRAGPERRRAVARRGADLPPRRPLAGRPRQVPPRGRGRGVARPRSARHRTGPACSRRRRRRGRARRDRGGGAGGGRRGRGRGDGRRPEPTPADARDARSGATEARRGGTDLSGRRSRAGIAQEMERDPIGRASSARTSAAAGGVFKTTEGLLDRFGPERVRDTPISEQAIVGAAMGAAMTGLRPIAELMFSDFFAVSWDMVANQIAKTRYMTDGQVSLPLVIRTANGGGLRFGAQHSPERRELGDGDPRPEGRRAVDAGRRGRAAGGRRSATPTRSSSASTRRSIATKGEVPDGEHVDRLGHGPHRPARDRRARSSPWRRWSRRPPRPPSILAAEHGISAEVDRRPLPRPARHDRRSSTRSPGRAGCSPSRRTRACCGWGAEIVSIVADEGFYDLDAPIVRITDAARPAAAAAALEDLAMPVGRADRRDGHDAAWTRLAEVTAVAHPRDRPDGIGDGRGGRERRIAAPPLQPHAGAGRGARRAPRSHAPGRHRPPSPPTSTSSISMVANGEAVEALHAGPDGIPAGIRAGSVVVDMSTVLPVDDPLGRAGRPGSGRRHPRRSGQWQHLARRGRQADDHGRRQRRRTSTGLDRPSTSSAPGCSTSAHSAPARR